MKITSFLLIGAACTLTGCAWTPKFVPPAEQQSGYTYIPVDPFPVAIKPGPSCAFGKGQPNYLKLPKGLPDNAVRMLIEQFDSSGNVTYGAAKAEGENKIFRVTTDFISADTLNFPVAIRKFAVPVNETQPKQIPFAQEIDPRFYKARSETYSVMRIPKGATIAPDDSSQVFNIPIYVGIGLRATADIVTLNTKANVTGLGVIGAEAESANLKGSLIVQTLGVNGKAVTAALPIQSELNRTTAQNAIVAVASIKTLLHADETDIAPRVVGLYLPFAGGKPLVNAIISELSTTPPEWERPCDSGAVAVAAGPG